MPKPDARPAAAPAPASPARVGERYPPIADYGFISDCHSMALVGRSGSIDWCCMPRADAASIFGRLLDWDRGGHCSIAPTDVRAEGFQSYVEDTLVLCNTFRTEGGEARLWDCFSMHAGGRTAPHRQLIRILEGVRGRIDFQIEVRPRFDYGEVKPWVRRHSARLHSCIGGNDGILVACDEPLKAGVGAHELSAMVTIRAEDRVRLAIEFVRPEDIEFEIPSVSDPQQLDDRLEETLRWWRRWSAQIKIKDDHRSAVVRSAIVLKGLTHAPTGAIAAAPTTSLPETPGGERNWDYRFSWIRDSAFSVRSLSDIGCTEEADGFRRFVQRTSAGSARDLQVMYGLGGERRLTEIELTLEGYRGARPVRIGNAASKQLQLDAYGTLVDLSWRWHRRGHSPDDDYWRFVVDLVDVACERWTEPDRGIWEIRGRSQHFVHSKVMCWTAIDKGIRMAKECMRRAPLRRWQKARKELRETIESRGVSRQGVFTQSFSSRQLDAAVLILPMVEFVAWDDPRMIATVDALMANLMDQGLLLRYRVEKTDDGLHGQEGTFLACSFWLAEVLARQGRREEARQVFDRAASTSNDLGLFAEEFDPQRGEMLGNYPQALTHLTHIAAAVALSETAGELSARPY